MRVLYIIGEPNSLGEVGTIIVLLIRLTLNYKPITYPKSLINNWMY